MSWDGVILLCCLLDPLLHIFRLHPLQAAHYTCAESPHCHHNLLPSRWLIFYYNWMYKYKERFDLWVILYVEVFPLIWVFFREAPLWEAAGVNWRAGTISIWCPNILSSSICPRGHLIFAPVVLKFHFMSACKAAWNRLVVIHRNQWNTGWFCIRSLYWSTSRHFPSDAHDVLSLDEKYHLKLVHLSLS